MNSIASWELKPSSSGTLLNRPCRRSFIGASVKNGASNSSIVSSDGCSGNSTDGTKARPMLLRASSSVKVFGDASTICCGGTFLKNSVGERNVSVGRNRRNYRHLRTSFSVSFVMKLSAFPSRNARSRGMSEIAQGLTVTPLCAMARL